MTPVILYYHHLRQLQRGHPRPNALSAHQVIMLPTQKSLLESADKLATTEAVQELANLGASWVGVRGLVGEGCEVREHIGILAQRWPIILLIEDD